MVPGLAAAEQHTASHRTLAGIGHGSIGSAGAAAEAAHHVGGAYGAALLQTAASAFVTGADHAVIAGVIATAAGAAIVFRTLRARRRTPAQAPILGEIAVPARTEVPVLAEVPVRTEVTVAAEVPVVAVVPVAGGMRVPEAARG